MSLWVILFLCSFIRLIVSYFPLGPMTYLGYLISLVMCDMTPSHGLCFKINQKAIAFIHKYLKRLLYCSYLYIILNHCRLYVSKNLSIFSTFLKTHFWSILYFQHLIDIYYNITLLSIILLICDFLFAYFGERLSILFTVSKNWSFV